MAVVTGWEVVRRRLYNKGFRQSTGVNYSEVEFCKALVCPKCGHQGMDHKSMSKDDHSIGFAVCPTCGAITKISERMNWHFPGGENER